MPIVEQFLEGIKNYPTEQLAKYEKLRRLSTMPEVVASEAPLFGGIGDIEKRAAGKIAQGFRGLNYDEDLVRKVNALIGGRVQYGRRLEEATQPSIPLSWSNHSQSWYIGGGTTKKGQQIKLDANQILVPKAWGTRSMLEAARSHLDELPLFSGSTEAWMRGKKPFGEFLKFPNRETNWPGLSTRFKDVIE